MKIRCPSTTLTLASLLAGCQATVQVIDQRPDFVSDAHVASAQWIGTWRPIKGRWSRASAVAIGPNRLVTNAHVWAPDDPWWSVDLPSKQKMLLFERGMESQAQVNKELAKSELSDHIRKASFRLIASGMSDLEFDSEGGATATSRMNCDWAVIETDSPSWNPEEVAVIHPPAMDPDWVVPEDVELFILGYSSIFEGATPRRRVDSEGSDIPPIAIPPIPIQPRPRDLLPFIRGGPYTLKGRSEILDGIWYVTYPHEWPRPGGHSGGGVFLWNEDAQRLELVGVFHTWDQATKTTIWESSLFGISVLSVQRSSEEKIRLLAFSPISGAGQALGLHRD